MTQKNENVIPRYKVWFDKRLGQLVTYDNTWTKQDWDSLVFIGELQPHQQPYKQDANGIYRVLYGKPRYYFVFVDGELRKASYFPPKESRKPVLFEL